MSTLPRDSKCHICHHPRSVYQCHECSNTTCAMCKLVRDARILCRICYHHLYPKPIVPATTTTTNRNQHPVYCSHCNQKLNCSMLTPLQAAETASLRMSWTCLPIQNNE